MIAIKIRSKRAGDPGETVYVPLDFNHHTGEWVSIMGPEGFFRTELGAAQSCHQHWLVFWGHIQQRIRRVRAYCDHPEFAGFEADGIDAGMIRESVQELADAIQLADANIQRLFGAVQDDDRVRIGSVLYGFDPEINGLREIPDDARRAPDALFLRTIEQAFTEVASTTSQPVSDRGVADAIDALLLRLQTADDGREAIQFLADQHFAKALAVNLRQVQERTGHGVSAHGLDELILVLRFWRERAFLANGYDASDIEVFWDDADLGHDPQSGDPDGVVQRAIDNDELIVPDKPVDPDALGDRDSLAGGSGPHVAADATEPAPDDDGSADQAATVETSGSDSDPEDP